MDAPLASSEPRCSEVGLNLAELAPSAEPMISGNARCGEVIDTNENIDKLVAAINEQSASLEILLASVTTAVDVLKPKTQSTDKRIAFWTAYKPLADEFDREFQEKYGDNLDASLIFAGLFSAVSSAFIIQIQPELQPDPNAATQVLLAILVQSITASSALPPGVPTPQPTAQTSVVVAQSLLYFSLFATLTAALLAVLGKQWLLHYNSVGQRGTIAERGLERQRKLDGMRRWNFDLLMQLFPLLLQFSLLLFASALSIYLWTIHRVIAASALTLTGLGSILYAVMVISAVVSPDSPFQTSLTFLLRTILDQFTLPARWHRDLQHTWPWLYGAFRKIHMACSRWWTRCPSPASVMTPLLPLFHTSGPLEPVPIFDSLDPPSEEVSAVVWALETSTEPALVETAAELVPELQWPVNLNVRSVLERLDDTFRSCIEHFHLWHVREGMTARATACFRAFWALDMVIDEDQRRRDLWTCAFARLKTTSTDLNSLVFWTRRTLDRHSTVSITPWTLRFIAAQDFPEETVKYLLEDYDLIPGDSTGVDESIFADFLFCLNSFFSPTTAHDRSLRNKSDHTSLLITLLFENLARRLTDPNPLDYSIANHIIVRVAQITNLARVRSLWTEDRCLDAAYRFCASPGVSQEAIASALHLVRVTRPLGLRLGSCRPGSGTTWLDRAIESVGSSSGHSEFLLVGDLWQALFLLPSARDTLSTGALRRLLSVLSSAEDDPDSEDWEEEAGRVAYFACGVVGAVDQWFADQELCQTLQQHSVWVNLGHLSWLNPFYTILCDKLSREPQWKNVISAELPGWLGHWQEIMEVSSDHHAQFLSVLSLVWEADETEANEFGHEATLAMVFSALANGWNQKHSSELSAQRVRYSIKLLECTVLVAFSARIRLGKLFVPSQRFKDTFFVRLGDALARAGDHIIKDNTEDFRDISNELTELLSGFVSMTLGELRMPQEVGKETEYRYWFRLRKAWLQDVDALRERFEMAASTRPTAQKGSEAA